MGCDIDMVFIFRELRDWRGKYIWNKKLYNDLFIY